MNKLFISIAVIGGILLFSACYNNKSDITKPTATSIASVSFRDDIVPIIISGACGCHNNNTTSAVQFSHLDTVFYGTILARSGVFNTMITGGGHPGEGGIYFTAADAALISQWIAQGAKDNYVPPAITGKVSYAVNIVPIYKSVCKGSSCHGGIGPTLDYSKLSADKTIISSMMVSSGSAGHPGGSISLDGTTTATFLAWIAQGLPQ